MSAGHFDKFNALLDHGWAASLGKLQLVLFLAYLKHANNQTGVCWLRDETLAAYIGHKRTNHVQAARRALAAAGLLEIIPTEQAYADGLIDTPYLTATVVRVLTPPAPAAEPGLFDHLELKPEPAPPRRVPDARQRTAAANGVSPSATLRPRLGANQSRIGSESVPVRECAYKDELPIEPPIKPEHTRTAARCREKWGQMFAARHGMPYSPERGDEAKLAEFLAKPAVAWDEARAAELMRRLLDSSWRQNLWTLCEAVNGLASSRSTPTRREAAPPRLTGNDRIWAALNTPDPLDEMLARAEGRAA